MAWWQNETGLPLPLGANVIKRDLGQELMESVATAIRESIKYGFSRRKEAIEYARLYGRNLVEEKVGRFVDMYVNDYTIDWGEKGRKAVTELLTRGFDAGIVPEIDRIDFIG